MTKTKKDITQAAPNSSVDSERVDALMAELFQHPTTRAMNPNLRVVNGRLERVPYKPPKVVPLRDPGGKRRAAAVREAILQMEEIFNGGLIDRVKNDDSITFALVTRCHDLNNGLMNRMDDQISTRALEGLVYRGKPLMHNDDQFEIESPVSKAAKSKTGRRTRKVAATA